MKMIREEQARELRSAADDLMDLYQDVLQPLYADPEIEDERQEAVARMREALEDAGL